MFGVGIFGVVVLLVVVTGLIGLATRSASGRRCVPVALTREWRLVQVTRGIGILTGVGAALAVGRSGSYGAGALLAPAAFGLCVLLAAAVGETVVRPRPVTGSRSASLTPRRIVDYLPAVLTPLVALMLLAAVATLGFTTATASRDEATATMRALSCTAPGLVNTRTPYPGSFYSVPLALTLLLVLAVAAMAAVQVVRRPRGLAVTDQGDDELRRRSLGVVVAATGIAVCAPLAGLAVVAGGGLKNLTQQQPSCAADWMGPVGNGLLLLAVVALGVTVGCLTRLAFGASERMPAGDVASLP
ncbi:MAG: hypothetical protein LH468_07830 [Nocardioides sp.]|nr:hypothetical protein [Nocardioides sp.]